MVNIEKIATNHNTATPTIIRIIAILILPFLIEACSPKEPIANDPINSLINKYEVRFNEAKDATIKAKVQEQFDASLEDLLKDSMRSIIQIPVIIKEKNRGLWPGCGLAYDSHAEW